MGHDPLILREDVLFVLGREARCDVGYDEVYRTFDDAALAAATG